VLAVFDNLIKFVSGMAGIGTVNPALGIWLLALVFNGGALWLYVTHPGQGAASPLRRFLRWLDREPRSAAQAAGAPGGKP
jgi:hypothetical protein